MEKYPPAINVLTSMSYGGVKIYDHVHGDMTTRCNPSIRDHLQHLKEASKGNVRARAAAYSEMRDFLLAHAADGAEAYHVAGGMSYCHACKTQCPLIDSRTAELDRSKSDRAYVGVNAGTCCEDFARYGSCSGFAGERMHAILTVTHRRGCLLLRVEHLQLPHTVTCTAELSALSLDEDGHFRRGLLCGLDVRPRLFGGFEQPFVELLHEGGHTLQTKANEEGKWMLKLKPMKGSSHALNMTVKSGDESLTLSNIVVGEVWICSGQSNMQWALSQVYDPDLEIMSANYPNIRIISVPQVGTQENQDDFDGQWDICTPDTVGQFSAVGYLFGRQLHQTLGVPIC